MVSYRLVEDHTDFLNPVTYCLTGSDDAGKPAMLALLQMEKYNHGNVSVQGTKKSFSAVQDPELGYIDNQGGKSGYRGYDFGDRWETMAFGVRFRI